MAAAIASLGFRVPPIIPRWLTWLSAIFFLEQVIETITVFGQTGFIAPGGTMNVYLGGGIGFLWVGGLVHWSLQRIDYAVLVCGLPRIYDMTPNHAREPMRNYVRGLSRQAAAARLRAIVARSCLIRFR